MLLEELKEQMKVRWLLLRCSALGIASSVLAWRHGQGEAAQRQGFCSVAIPGANPVAMSAATLVATSVGHFPCWASCACLLPH